MVFFFFFLQHVGLVPWPKIKPVPPAVKCSVLTTGLPGKSQKMKFLSTREWGQRWGRLLEQRRRKAIGRIVCVCVCSVTFGSLQTHGLRQAPLFVEFSRQEYWSGLPCPPPGYLPNPGIESKTPASPAWQADTLPLSHWGSPTGSINAFFFHPLWVAGQGEETEQG